MYWKAPVLESLFNKVDLNIENFLRTHFSQNFSGRLPLESSNQTSFT